MNSTLNNLKEWSILHELIDKIPTQCQKGLFWTEINFTCVDVDPEFIAVGTNCGIIFWYNRKKRNILELKCEVGIIFRNTCCSFNKI